MSFSRSTMRMGMAVLSGGLAFAGSASDGYVDNVSLDVSDASATAPTASAASPANNAVEAGPVVDLEVTLEDRATAVELNSIQLFLDDALAQRTPRSLK